MIKWYKADTLPTTPTVLDDGVWFVKKGKDFFDVYIISEGVIKSLDIEVPTDAISTPTLAEVLAEGNNAGEKVIKFEWENGINPLIESHNYEIGKDGTTSAFSIRDLISNKRIDFLGQFDPTGLDLYRGSDVVESDTYEYWEIGYNGSNNSRGLVGSEYFGAYYNDNTYVQKRYVDNVVFNYALKKPTIEGTSGQVLTAGRLGSYAWKDVIVKITTNNSEIEFTGDGTPANPLQATVGNKTPYKAIDTSVVEPDLAQLTAHGTDRVDFPNLNRIYFLNGAKWTYVETIDL